MRGAEAWQSPQNANALPDVETLTLLELVQCLLAYISWRHQFGHRGPTSSTSQANPRGGIVCWIQDVRVKNQNFENQHLFKKFRKEMYLCVKQSIQRGHPYAAPAQDSSLNKFFQHSSISLTCTGYPKKSCQLNSEGNVGRLDIQTAMNDSNTAISKEEELVIRGSLAKEELKHHYSVY